MKGNQYFSLPLFTILIIYCFGQDLSHEQSVDSLSSKEIDENNLLYPSLLLPLDNQREIKTTETSSLSKSSRPRLELLDYEIVRISPLEKLKFTCISLVLILTTNYFIWNFE